MTGLLPPRIWGRERKMSDELFKIMVGMVKDYADATAKLSVVTNIVNVELKDKYPDATAAKIANALGLNIPEKSDVDK